jgi:hypothetical protein
MLHRPSTTFSDGPTLKEDLMADVSAAVIGFAGVLAGGYFNNFFAEDYKRFRDSQALAGALVKGSRIR